jgi:hypothetical protein
MSSIRKVTAALNHALDRLVLPEGYRGKFAIERDSSNQNRYYVRCAGNRLTESLSLTALLRSLEGNTRWLQSYAWSHAMSRLRDTENRVVSADDNLGVTVTAFHNGTDYVLIWTKRISGYQSEGFISAPETYRITQNLPF